MTMASYRFFMFGVETPQLPRIKSIEPERWIVQSR